MGMNRAELVPAIQAQLKDTTGDTWSTASIEAAIARVVNNISEREPLQDRVILPIIEYTNTVDVSSLHELVYTVICTCDNIWTAKSNVACTLDSDIKKSGTASSKCAVGAPFTTGLIATIDITSTNLSNMRSVRFWIRTSADVDAGELQICLDDTAACASPKETLNIPALTANKWKLVEVEFDDPEALTAIISLGLNAYSDPGTLNIWIDDIRVRSMEQSNLVEIYKVEYPVGDSPPTFRNFTAHNLKTLTVNLSTIPTIVGGTLTGTVTFTGDSNAVTGVGTLFSSELDTGYFIRTSTCSHWYRIAEVVSDTSLVLDEAFEEITVTDTVSATMYRDSDGCVSIRFGRQYTLNDSYSDLPSRFNDLLVLGAVAHCLTAEASKTTNWVNLGEQAAAGYRTLMSTTLGLYESKLKELGRFEDNVSEIYSMD